MMALIATDFPSCSQIVSLMVILGFMIHHMLRINMPIAIVEMTAKNTSTTQMFRFDWNEKEKNDILGCFFWGYVLTEIPGGLLSEMFGSRIVLGTSMLLASVLTFLTAPAAIYFPYEWVIVVRVCLGFTMGVQWPAVPPMANRWVAPTDNSKFMSHMMASSLGAALTLPVCGYLIHYLGWPSVFYATGGVTLVWTMMWFYLVYDSPRQHPRIRREEKEKLEKVIDCEIRNLKKRKAPLRKIFASGPVWAIALANACSSFNFYIVSNQLPSYMYQVLHFNIKQNGVLSGLPLVVRYSVAVASCYVADRLRKTQKFSTITIRKFFTTLCFWGPAALFTLQAFWGYNRIMSIAVFTVSLGFNGLGTAGFFSNCLDISPRYSGTVFGLSNASAAICGYISTKIVGVILAERQTFEQWSYIFWFLVSMNLIGSIVYLVFASGDVQSWDSKENEVEQTEGSEHNTLKIDDIGNKC